MSPSHGQLVLYLLFPYLVSVLGTYIKSNAVVVVPRYSNLGRAKRAVGSRLSQSDINLSLQAHNDARKLEGASDIRYMTWNPDLAAMAQGWADLCVWKHGQPSGLTSSYPQVGQNLYAKTAQTLNITEGIWAWYNEKQYYKYDTLTCTPGEMCGHYTQVVWSNTTEIGCAINNCIPLNSPAGVVIPSGVYLVCNYGPPGNYDGVKPYLKGDPCTQCWSGSYYCFDSAFCRSKTECDANKVQCPCNGKTCKNCANVTSGCTCSCADGYSGKTCSDSCQDQNPKCGANPGWPVSWCNQASVMEGCPKMCGLCRIKTATSAPCLSGCSSKYPRNLFCLLMLLQFLQIAVQ